MDNKVNASVDKVNTPARRSSTRVTQNQTPTALDRFNIAVDKLIVETKKQIEKNNAAKTTEMSIVEPAETTTTQTEITLKVSAEYFSKRPGDTFHDFLVDRGQFNQTTSDDKLNDDKLKFVMLVLYFNLFVNLTPDNIYNEDMGERAKGIFKSLLDNDNTKLFTPNGNKLAHTVMTYEHNDTKNYIQASRILYDRNYNHPVFYIVLLLKNQLETMDGLYDDLKEFYKFNENYKYTQLPIHNFSKFVNDFDHENNKMKVPYLYAFVIILQSYYNDDADQRLLNVLISDDNFDNFFPIMSFFNNRSNREDVITEIGYAIQNYFNQFKHMLHINHDFPTIYRPYIVNNNKKEYNQLNVVKLANIINAIDEDDEDEPSTSSIMKMNQFSLEKLFPEVNNLIFEGDAHSKLISSLTILFEKQQHVYRLNTMAGQLDAAGDALSKQAHYAISYSNQNASLKHHLVELEESDKTDIYFNNDEGTQIQITTITRNENIVEINGNSENYKIKFINLLHTTLLSEEEEITNFWGKLEDIIINMQDYTDTVLIDESNEQINETYAKIVNFIKEVLNNELNIDVLQDEFHTDKSHDIYQIDRNVNHENSIERQEKPPSSFFCHSCNNWHRFNQKDILSNVLNQRDPEIWEKFNTSDVKKFSNARKISKSNKSYLLHLYTLRYIKHDSINIFIAHIKTLNKPNVSFSFPNNPFNINTSKKFDTISVESTSTTSKSHFDSKPNNQTLFNSIFESNSLNINLIKNTGLNFFYPLLAKGSGDINPFVCLAHDSIVNLTKNNVVYVKTKHKTGKTNPTQSETQDSEVNYYNRVEERQVITGKTLVFYDTGDQNAYLLLLLLAGSNPDKFNNVVMTTSYTSQTDPIVLCVRIGDNEDIFEPVHRGDEKIQRSYGTYHNQYRRTLDNLLGTYYYFRDNHSVKMETIKEEEEKTEEEEGENSTSNVENMDTSEESKKEGEGEGENVGQRKRGELEYFTPTKIAKKASNQSSAVKSGGSKRRRKTKNKHSKRNLKSNKNSSKKKKHVNRLKTSMKKR